MPIPLSDIDWLVGLVRGADFVVGKKITDRDGHDASVELLESNFRKLRDALSTDAHQGRGSLTTSSSRSLSIAGTTLILRRDSNRCYIRGFRPASRVESATGQIFVLGLGVGSSGEAEYRFVDVPSACEAFNLSPSEAVRQWTRSGRATPSVAEGDTTNLEIAEPSREEYEQVVSRLCDLGPDVLAELLDPKILKIANLSGQAAPAVAVADANVLAQLVVQQYNKDLLASRHLRTELFRQWHPDRQAQVLDEEGYDIGPPSTRVGKLASIKWGKGKRWAKRVCRELQISERFAGEVREQRAPSEEEISPFVPLRQLEDFQLSVHEQITELMLAPLNRGIVKLPTGTGKTRTAVEAALAAHCRGDIAGPILWMAHSDELCEQAVLAFKEVWTDLGSRSAELHKPKGVLRISRRWRGYGGDYDCDVMVASVQTLYQSVDTLRNEIEPGLVIVDEAHKAVATSFRQVLRQFGLDSGRLHREGMSPPLIGLTATPMRTTERELTVLASLFLRNIIQPRDISPEQLEQVLRQRGVLSTPRHEFIGNQGDDGTTVIDLDVHGIARDRWTQLGDDLIAPALGVLAENTARNELIINRLAQLGDDQSTLLFACSVPHASALCLLLNRRGVSASVITGQTHPSDRRSIIEAFRRGKIKVICNFNVLTTGFDAPRIDTIMITRPTTSPILYRQMVGRGLRGPLFGGTEHCRIFDIRENLRFGGKVLDLVDFVKLADRPEEGDEGGLERDDEGG